MPYMSEFCAAEAFKPPRKDYVLPPHEVHVWRAFLDQPERSLSLFNDLLSAEERARAARYHFEADRKRCTIARGLSRLLLGHCLRCAPERLEFEYNAFGKPALAQGSNASLQFNVSHSGDVVLFAFAIDRALGVDVEQMKQEMASPEIAARYFSPAERQTLFTLRPEMRCEAFFACWTRKEAYLKARGDGLSLPLDRFDVAFGPGEPPRLVATRHDPVEAGRYTLRALDVGPGYAAALAVEGSSWRLACWDWPRDPSFRNVSWLWRACRTAAR
jgi:4'-phosphopantetheinyl transferase